MLLRLIALASAVLLIGFLVEHLETALWITATLLVLFFVISRWGYKLLVHLL